MLQRFRRSLTTHITNSSRPPYSCSPSVFSPASVPIPSSSMSCRWFTSGCFARRILDAALVTRCSYNCVYMSFRATCYSSALSLSPLYCYCPPLLLLPHIVVLAIVRFSHLLEILNSLSACSAHLFAYVCVSSCLCLLFPLRALSTTSRDLFNLRLIVAPPSLSLFLPSEPRCR